MTHRASSPYKAFRAAVAQEGLLERPSDLRFWIPTGIGFLGRPGTVNLMKTGHGDECQYAIVNELRPGAGMKGNTLEQLRRLACLAADTASIRSFSVLDRGAQDQDETLLVFGLFTTKNDANRFEDGYAKEIWQSLEEACERRRTTWVECGVGFIGRR